MLARLFAYTSWKTLVKIGRPKMIHGERIKNKYDDDFMIYYKFEDRLCNMGKFNHCLIRKQKEVGQKTLGGLND